MPASVFVLLQHLPTLINAAGKLYELIQRAIDEDRELTDDELDELAGELVKAQLNTDAIRERVRAKLEEAASQ